MIKKLFSRKSLFVFFLILFIPSLAFAEMQVHQEYKDYTILKGDTLWDISQQELQDPFLWPILWRSYIFMNFAMMSNIQRILIGIE